MKQKAHRIAHDSRYVYAMKTMRKHICQLEFIVADWSIYAPCDSITFMKICHKERATLDLFIYRVCTHDMI